MQPLREMFYALELRRTLRTFRARQTRAEAAGAIGTASRRRLANGGGVRATLDPREHFGLDAAVVTNVLFHMTPVRKEHGIVMFQMNDVILTGLGGIAASLVMRMIGHEDHLGERAICVALLGDRIKWAVRAQVVTHGMVCSGTLTIDLVT